MEALPKNPKSMAVAVIPVFMFFVPALVCAGCRTFDTVNPPANRTITWSR